jgi:hypothetical protein
MLLLRRLVCVSVTNRNPQKQHPFDEQ